MLSWVHFGDLHASDDDQFGSLDHLKSMIRMVNRHLSTRIDFAFLPGDNANNGTPEQYRRIVDAVSELQLPLFAIPGDHDYEPGDLRAFRDLASDPLPMSRLVNGHRCIFLDVVSAGGGGPDFRLSDRDRDWLERELSLSAQDREASAVFMHAYPGDLADGDALAQRFARAHVAVVDTGHTHYNELLNDGWVVYAATRSTGQIEEDYGRPGFSVTAIDGGVASWKFHPIDAPWPFVMITSPADRRLHRWRSASESAESSESPESPESPDEGCVRVLVSDDDIVSVTGDIGGVPIELSPDADNAGIWQAAWPTLTATDRVLLTVTARTADGRIGADSIELPSVNQPRASFSDFPALGTDAHAVDPWPAHGIVGTQLGPNKNGRHW